MRGLQLVQFGLFLIILGFGVILFADLLIVGGVVSMFSSGVEFGFKIVAWGVSAILIGALAGGLGKLLCIPAPEEKARVLIVASVFCDIGIFGIYFAIATGVWMGISANIVIWLLSN